MYSYPEELTSFQMIVSLDGGSKPLVKSPNLC